MTTGTTAPGWYPDPQTPGMVRYFDGQQWTAQTAVAAPAAQPAVVAPYTMVTTQNRRTSHGLHLFLTIITAGAWGLFVWLPLTIIHKLHKEKVTTRVG